MSDTKACNLTEREIKTLIAAKMSQTLNTPEEALDLDDVIDRLKYLNSRLKAFGDKSETKTEVAAGAWPTNG
jgi:hypothetical protein